LYAPDKSPNQSEYANHYAAYKSLEKTDHFLQESKMWRHIIKTTCDRLNIKLIEVSFWHDDPFSIEAELPSIRLDSNINDINYCFGRDYHIGAGHPGIGIHKEMSELIISLL
jgi:hypothetical protein